MNVQRLAAGMPVDAAESHATGRLGQERSNTRLAREAPGATHDARAAIDAATSEADLARCVEDLLHRTGWHWFHPRHAEQSATILDYIAWRERLIWLELKREDGELTVDRWVRGKDGRMHFVVGQVTVIQQLREARQEVWVFHPSDWEKICEVLT